MVTKPARDRAQELDQLRSEWCVVMLPFTPAALTDERVVQL
jgi:hypothetical protein